MPISHGTGLPSRESSLPVDPAAREALRRELYARDAAVALLRAGRAKHSAKCRGDDLFRAVLVTPGIRAGAQTTVPAACAGATTAVVGHDRFEYLPDRRLCRGGPFHGDGGGQG
jgi:hypothetical protein